MNELSLVVRDCAGVDALRPVAGGVPIAEGAAPEGALFALRDAQGNAVPVQTSVLATWKDGSARWVLLDFQARPPKNGESPYTLRWQNGGSGALPEAPCRVDAEAFKLDAGPVRVCLGSDALLNLSDRLDVHFELTDAHGQICRAVVASKGIETTGPLRATMCLKGAFFRSGEDRVFQFQVRVSLFSGLSKVRIEPLILVDADSGIIQRIRELKLVFRPRKEVQSARMGPTWSGAVSPAVRLFQYDDEHFRIEGAHRTGDKAPGWASVEDGQGEMAVALRDFWQQWPKALSVSPEGFSVDLFPRFEAGAFAHMEPWYKHQYLFEGACYQLRTGQARRWDLWVDLEGHGADLSKMADAPLVPAADPAQAIATGVWGAIAPAGIPQMAEYDTWAENLFNAYCHSIAVQRDYGAMNWGDWFGERQVNWGNHEYDTPLQILIQYARTGDPQYFRVADAAARHFSEVDTVHFVNAELAQYFNDNWGRPAYPPRAGMMHQHAVGHVGGFHPVDRILDLFVEKGIGQYSRRPYLCLDPFNLGHVWTQGMAQHYFLTGDPFLKETVETIGQNLARLVEDREYKFMGHTHCGRTTGWPLLALGGAYEVSFDRRYLEAMKTLADDALATQDPVCGGWLIQPMAPDHCLCKTARHTGMAGFITAVLINGLSRYYFLSGDDRLPEAIERAVTFLDNDTWREAWKDWRYTSCPATRATGQPGVVVMAYVNSVRISNNPEHLRVLRIAWETKFKRLAEAPPAPGPGQGKTYTSKMYGCAEAIGLLATGESGGGV